MKEYRRQYPYFALCGLCPIYHMPNGGPGCGGGEGHQKCAVITCSLQHGRTEYCYQCGQYPCERYDDIDAFDSFLPHRTRKKDFKKAKEKVNRSDFWRPTAV